MQKIFRISQLLFVAALVIITLPSLCLAFSGGTGTETNPYQIADANDLLELAADIGNYDKYFILTADIDLEGQTFTTAIIAPDTDNATPGFQGTAFRGFIDGSNHKITHFSIDGGSNDYLGVVGCTNIFIGSIQNLGIENYTINSSAGSEYVGGLVGDNSGFMMNCFSQGTIQSSGEYVGGLAGVNQGVIIDCYNTGIIGGSNSIGGLIGINCQCDVMNCYNTGRVTGSNQVGGLIGYNNSTIASSGLGFGSNVTNCLNTGTVNGSNQVGGLIGYSYNTNNPFTINRPSYITNCYNAGIVSGSCQVGGLVGDNCSTVTYCYSTGVVTGISDTGGLMGNNTIGTVSSSFWDTETSGQTTSAVGMGKTTEEMKTLSTFTSSGWDFSGTDGDTPDWAMLGNEYPHLIWEITVLIPNVVGQTQSDAQITLSSMGLMVEVDGVGSPTVPAGSVISQSPAAGQSVTGGTTINLLISLGKRYSGGTGRPEDPYLVSSAEDLNSIGLHSEDWIRCFVLTNDIDMSGITGTQYNIIGDGNNFFTGNFNGNNFKIMNFSYHDTSKQVVGLFGYAGGGTIVIGGSIASNGAIIENLQMIDVDIEGNQYTSGLAGNSSGIIRNCFVSGTIVGTYRIGFITGDNYGVISNCHAEGSIFGQAYVGGLVGENDNDTISESSFEGSVTGTGDLVGGITGYNGGTINSCYSKANISGVNDIGGLVGYNFDNSDIIKNCYAEGTVTGTSLVGGLVGVNFVGKISCCYANSLVTGTDQTGGLVGANTNGEMYNSFWDIQSSGQTNSAAGQGKTTAEMKDISTYMGWNTPESKEWKINDDIDYPRLAWESAPGTMIPSYTLSDFLEGSGTVSDPYLVKTAEQLSCIGRFPDEMNKNYRLMADIDLSTYNESNFSIIGPCYHISFKGIFDGNNHTVSHFNYSAPDRDYIGLFGYLDSGAIVENLGLSEINVSGDFQVGGLAAVNNGGTITQCYVDGSVNGSGSTGGLIGSNNGKVLNCYTKGTVSDLMSAAGLIGAVYSGLVSNCYSQCAINPDSGHLGHGLIGYQPGGEIINSFWDTQISGQTTSHGGIGKTTEEMKTLATFTSAGWDLTNETANGIDDTWTMFTGQYPCLTWQYLIVGDIAVPYGVEISDLQKLAEHWLQTGCPAGCDGADLTSDGTVDLFDFAILAQHWLETTLLGTTIVVPDVEGLTSEDAATAIYTAGLTVGTTFNSRSETVAEGSIISQIPAAGSVVYPNSPVNLEISLGSNVSFVPSIVAMTEMDAVFLLQSVQLTATITYSYSDTIEVGSVISQSPAAETMVAQNSTVDIVVSLGTIYSGGSGTSENPFRIASKADLLQWAADIDNYNKCLILTADINLEGQTFTTAIIAPDTTDDSDCKFDGTPFIGTLDGNGHKISNFIINGKSNDYLGLFGYIDTGGQIKNLSLENETISSSSGSMYVGGLAGWNDYGNISNCYTAGSVDGTSWVGGLVGWNFGNINNCYSIAAVSGYQYVGGLTGGNSENIRYSYSTGNVNGSFDVGGLAGYHFGDMRDSYSKGNVNGISSLGGLVGSNYSASISRCYSTGIVNSPAGSNNVGGLVGVDDYGGSTVNSFWDKETSIQTTSAGGTGLTTAEMKTLSTFTSAGWDFVGETINGTNDYWEIQINGTEYPYLSWQKYSGGNGTAQDPYQISTAEEMNAIGLRPEDWGKCFILMADIDMSIYGGTLYNIVGNNNTNFTGTFDGDGHGIRNLTYNGIAKWIGLFGIIDNATIKNLGLENVNIIIHSSSYTPYLGGLVGRQNYSTIDNCYVTGIISSSASSSYDYAYSGGLVGYQLSGTINNCYSTAAVSASSMINSIAGGLIGQQLGGIVSDCYSTGTVNASSSYDSSKSYAGGLIGQQYTGVINHCYATGKVTDSSYYSYSGGLVGWQRDSTIKNSYAKGEVNVSCLGDSYAGGLVGHRDYSGTINNSYATGEVSISSTRATSVAGGLVGRQSSETIYNCYSTGIVSVFSDSSYAGGLVGVNNSTIMNCYATGEVTASSYGFSFAGGLVASSVGTVLNCYAMGSTNASATVNSSCAGGLIGSTSGTVMNCYAVGLVSASSSTSYAGGLVGRQQKYSSIIKNSYSTGKVVDGLYKGGFLGYKESSFASVTACFWDKETSEMTNSAGGPDVQSKTTAEMKTLWTFTLAPALWDFTDESTNGTDDVWRMCTDNVNYPHLTWEYVKNGDFICPDGVNTEDLDILTACWLETTEARADMNDDDSVNLADFITLAQQWLKTDCGLCGGVDITGDGSVDQSDLTLMADQWLLQENVGCRMTDLNDDGKIDLADYAIFATHWLKGI